MAKAKTKEQDPYIDIVVGQEESDALDAAEGQILDVVNKLMGRFRQSKPPDYVLALGANLACRLSGHLLAKHVQRTKTVCSDWKASPPEIGGYTLHHIFIPQILKYASDEYAKLPKGSIN